MIRHGGQGSHGRRGNPPLRPLPGSQSRRRPETHRRGQPLQSEARSAKNAPESAICGVLPYRPAPTGSVLWLVPISNPRSAPRRVGRTNLPSDALRLWRSPPPCGSIDVQSSSVRLACCWREVTLVLSFVVEDLCSVPHPLAFSLQDLAFARPRPGGIVFP